ncbi:unnamed protein product [Adineta ricciae]|uniref:Uncharacterized protein n=1 Tax=Adineta ricciae TaxID=249248 RepID=A0A814JL90_ADIRI|nr:unnamed protein product [Adineta ricciae]
MSNNELERLQASIGEFISVNSFCSTITDCTIAVFFLGALIKGNGQQRILFETEADPHVAGVKPFGIIFVRLVAILTKKKDNNYELKTFFDRMKKEFCGTNKAILGHFGNVFRSMGKCDDAEKYYRRLLKELSENHHRIFPAVTADLELSLAVKANTSKVRNIIEKLFTSLNEWIGNVSLTSVVAWVQALHFYEIALDMHRQIVGIDHTHAAICFGNIYQEKKNYSKALDYHQKALNRWEQSLRVHHYHLGSLHDNIGNVYYYLKQCDRALQHYRQSLDVKSKSLLDYHPSIASTLKKYWQSV